jgi:arylsulfatase A-like enzyme
MTAIWTRTLITLASKLLSVLPALGIAIAASCAVRGAEISARPNILWVVSEDNTFHYVGAYGDPLARTPNLDRLARQGIAFDRVYTEPVCAPSRSTIITGRYASSLGTQHMRSLRPLPADVKFFPEYLRAAGYFCTNNNKTDYNTSTIADQGRRVDTNSNGQSRVFADGKETVYSDVWNENGPNAHWRHRRPEQPFFAVFNFMESHESRMITRQPLTTDPAKVRVPAYLPDTPVVRNDLAQYYDCVSRADAGIGKVLAELDSDGLANDTIVFYYSDNGGVVEGPKRFLNDQGTHVAMLARFPEKFSGLAPARPGTHDGELINFVDLAPTTLSLAGVVVPESMQGRAFAGAARTAPPQFTLTLADRMDERYNLVRAVTDGRYRYVRDYYPDRPWGQHLDYLWQVAFIREWELQFQAGALTPAQRRFFEPAHAEALFDCDADPDNVNDLSRDPAQQERLHTMRAALRETLLRIRDTGFMPEPMMIAEAHGASPTVAARDDARYPLRRLLELIDAIQLSDDSSTREIANAAASDPMPVVRYWAAVAALRSKSTYAVQLLDDRDPVVRVTAAEALLRENENAPAMHVIEAAIQQTQQPELCLFALNSLARSPRSPTKALRPKLGQLAASDDFLGFDYYLARAARPLLERR